MSTPILLSIVLAMQTDLQAIATASGYHYTVKSTSVRTKADNLMALPTTETPVILLGHRIEAMGRDFKGSRPVSVQDRWRFVLEARVDIDTSDPESAITAFANLASDLEKALTVDVAANRAIYGGLVLYVYVGQPIPHFGLLAQRQVYLEQPVDVLLQRTYTQP